MVSLVAEALARQPKDSMQVNQESYWLALGTFVDRWANLESAVGLLLQQITNVPPGVARAIFSGTRVKGALDFMNRILDAKDNKKLKEEMRPTFLHIQAILKMRDEILHHGATIKDVGPEFILSNESRAHLPNLIERKIISPEIIDKMTYDVDTIYIKLLIFYFISKGGRIDHQRSDVNARASQPWRYTPFQPKARLNTTQRKTPKRRSRRQSSQG